MQQGLVSVVICAYNNWPDLEMTIASALFQSFQSLEIIVVDNSSTDATQAEVPKRFGTRVNYLRQPNRDCAGAYNTGLAASHGEFVQFIDGDDVLAPNKIEKQLEFFRRDPKLDIVYGDVRTFQTSDGVAEWIDSAMRPEEDVLARLTAPNGIWFNTLGVLFRRIALNKTGPWDENLYVEDADYFLRAAWTGCSFGYCPLSPAGFRRLRPGQKMGNSPAMERGLEEVWSKALGYITEEPYRSQLRAKIAEHRLRRAVFREQMPRGQALALLASARSMNPMTISRLMHALCCAAIILPWGRSFARLGAFSSIRRVIGRPLQIESGAPSVARSTQ